MGWEELVSTKNKRVNKWVILKTTPKWVFENLYYKYWSGFLRVVYICWMKLPEDEKIRTFIAFVQKDQRYLKRLEDHLTPLKRESLIKVWHKGCIIAGTEWDKSITNELLSSDIVLLLVTSNAIAEDNWHDKQMKLALSQYKKGKAVVIGIIIKACTWEITELSDYVTLPENGWAVTNTKWNGIDNAYTNVVNSLQKIIFNIYAKRAAKGNSLIEECINFDPEVIFKAYYNEAQELRKKQNWVIAKKKYQETLARYEKGFLPSITMLENYMKTCDLKIEVESFLKKANKAYKQKNYIATIKFAEEALEIQSDNKTCAALVRKAKEQITKRKQIVTKILQEIETLLLFNKKKEAIEQFQKIIITFEDLLTESSKGYYKKRIKSLEKEIDFGKKKSIALEQYEKENYPSALISIEQALKLSDDFELAEVKRKIIQKQETQKQEPKEVEKKEVVPIVKKQESTTINPLLSKPPPPKKTYLTRRYVSILAILFILFFIVLFMYFNCNSPKSISEKPPSHKKEKTITTPQSSNPHKLKIIQKNNKYCVVDKTGKEVIPPIYENIQFVDGDILVHQKAKYGLFDETGKEIIPVIYDFLKEGDNVFLTKQGNKYGFLDKNGQAMIPSKYEQALYFSEGLAAVKKNGLWGFINKADSLVLPFKYQAALNFTEGYAGVKLGNKWGFIDKKGYRNTPFIYNRVEPFKNGQAAVYPNEKAHYISFTGKCLKDCP